MAKKIRFPLELADGTQARSMDDLKEHFDLESVLGYYKNGKLLTWLQDRYFDDEAAAVAQLNENDSDFQAKLCAVFGMAYQSGVDLEAIAVRQERIAKLRQFTDDEAIIKNIDVVAFDQEELADLLDEGASEIYLCGSVFRIPVSQQDKTYIGVNTPKVQISGNVSDPDKISGIMIRACEIDSPVLKQACSTAVEEQKRQEEIRNSVEKEISEEVADRIVGAFRVEGLSRDSVETTGHFIRHAVLSRLGRGLQIINKTTGELTVVKNTELYGSDASNTPELYTYKNKLYLSTRDNKNLCLDLDKREKKLFQSKFGLSSRVAINDHFFSKETNGTVSVLNLDTGKTQLLQHRVQGSNGGLLCTENHLYFLADYDQLIEYSFASKMERIITAVPGTLGCEDLRIYNGQLYMLLLIGIQENHYTYRVDSVNLQNSSERKTVASNLKVTRLGMGWMVPWAYGWYFVAFKKDYPLERFDFRDNSITTMALHCGYDKANSFCIVGNWVYFNYGKEKHVAKVPQDKPLSVVIEEDFYSQHELDVPVDNPFLKLFNF